MLCKNGPTALLKRAPVLLNFKEHLFRKTTVNAWLWKSAPNFRKSSHQRCPLKKVFLEISQNSKENTCARASFLIKLQVAPANLLKRDSGTGIFVWILRNFKEYLFHRRPDDCFWITKFLFLNVSYRILHGFRYCNT